MCEKKLSLISLGPGYENLLTLDAKNALLDAKIIFAAKRLLDSARKICNPQALFVEKYRPEEVFSFLRDRPDCDSAAVLFSGDGGFFSGAALFKNLPSCDDCESWKTELYPGISSAVYFASKLKKSWQGWKFLSMHGRSCNFIGQIRKNPASFFILSGENDLEICIEKLKKALENKILKTVKCYVGSNLSYDVEKIIQFDEDSVYSSDLFSELHKSSEERGCLLVLFVENEGAKSETLLPSLEDEDFLRREKIPMTKKEVRRLSLTFLGLSESSIVFDVGSGTGSVTVEAARIASEGRVFAVECEKEAFNLTKDNVEKFCLENVTCIFGNAPQCLKEIPEISGVTHVFIGGSRGNLSEICEFFLKINPNVRIVANFVSLENLCEMQNLLKSLENQGKKAEITQIAVSRAEKTGNFHLMKAQNPVYIVKI